MSTNDSKSGITADAEELRALIAGLSKQEATIFRDLMMEIKQHGAGVSRATLDQMAKKYADKARKLVGES